MNESSDIFYIQEKRKKGRKRERERDLQIKN